MCLTRRAVNGYKGSIMTDAYEQLQHDVEAEIRELRSFLATLIRMRKRLRKGNEPHRGVPISALSPPAEPSQQPAVRETWPASIHRVLHEQGTWMTPPEIGAVLERQGRTVRGKTTVTTTVRSTLHRIHDKKTGEYDWIKRTNLEGPTTWASRGALDRLPLKGEQGGEES